MLSAYLEWVSDLAMMISQAIGQYISERMRSDTAHWPKIATKFCVFALIYLLLTVGVFTVSLSLAWLVFKVTF